MFIRRLSSLLKTSFTEFTADHGSELAASIAFHLFYSVFPMAIAAVYVSGTVPELQNVQGYILGGISYLLPGFGELIAGIANNVETVRGGIGVLIIIGGIWGSISFFNTVTLSLNVVWGNRRPLTLFQTQLINFLVLVGAGVFVLLSIFFTIVLNDSTGPIVHNDINRFLDSNRAMLITSNILVTSFAFLLFLLFYKFMPETRPAWKDIWLGALVASLFFESTKLIFILFLRLFNPYNLVDRSISTAIGFMMWAYMSSLVFLFVAKTTYVNLKLRPEKERPDDDE